MQQHYSDKAGCIYLFWNTHVTTIKEIEVMNLKQTNEVYGRGWREERKEEKLYSYIFKEIKNG